ncbi:hypothetical protein [Streptomyces tubercidicus]
MVDSLLEVAAVHGGALGSVSPIGGGEDAREGDGFGIDRRAETRDREGRFRGAGWDEEVGPADPVVPCVAVVFFRERPELGADEEAGEHCVVGDGPPVAVEETQVSALCVDDLWKSIERGGQLAVVGRPDPDPVLNADIAVMRQ